MKKVFAFALVLALVFALGAPAYADGAFKIGAQGPLTGGAAIYGTAVMNAAQIAVDEINAAGGMQFEFQAQDDEADSGDKAINAYNTLMDWGMQILLGPVTSGSGITVAAQAFDERTFLLTPSGSSVDLIADKDNAFSRSASPTPTRASPPLTTLPTTSPAQRSPSSTATTTLILRASATPS